MATATWASGYWNPWIIYPSVADTVADFGFVLGTLPGSAATTWGNEGITAATVVTGEGEQIGSVIKFNMAGSASCSIQYKDRCVPYFKQSTALTMYSYCRVKSDAVPVDTNFTITVQFLNSALAPTGAGITLVPFSSGQLASDDTWVIKRASQAVTIPADAAAITVNVGYLNGDGPHTNTTYLDWVTIGFDLNFADLGPSNHGALLAEKLGITKTYARTLNQADSGALEGTVLNTGLYDLSFKSTPIDETAYTKYKNFFDYCSDKSTFTFWRNQTDFTRDFVQKLILEQDNDGVSRIKGTPLYQFEIKASEAT